MKRIFCCIFAIACAFGQCCAQEKYHKVNNKDFVIVYKNDGAKFGFDTSIMPVINSLGTPSKRLKVKASSAEWNVWEYAWRGINIEAFEGDNTINYIEIVSDKFSTIRGLKIGDRITKVTNVYGSPDVKSETLIEYDYLDPDAIWGLVFFYKDGAVSKIILSRKN